MSAAAASWKAAGIEPTLASAPVDGSIENTPPTDAPEASNPPAM